MLAIEEVRGHSSLHTGADATINQITYGEVLAVKIVPAAAGVDATPLVASGPEWRSTLTPGAGWEQTGFDDSAWGKVESLGVLGSKQDFLQWNADAGLYAWPGYAGITQNLRVFALKPVTVTPVGGGELVDFGREISGRVRLKSRTDAAIDVVSSYGESQEPALKGKSYLGPRVITLPPHSVAYGPKSGFRFVKLALPGGVMTGDVEVEAQGITFPVEYAGSFESSDAELNRIWETAAYTARLCMQEGIWDAPKRDRGQWMGDLDVTGRTIEAVFGGAKSDALMEQTMASILGPPPVTRDVNTIAGYSALWVTGQAEFYRHSGDRAYLRRMRGRLVGLLQLMDAEVDPATGVFTNAEKHKVFVDWSPGLSSDTPEARAATTFEFIMAYRQAGFLLGAMGDGAMAAEYHDKAERMEVAAREQLLTPGGNTFGTRWQVNAAAVLSGAANAAERAAIWKDVLSQVGTAPQVVTPYYGYYVLEAMAELGHREQALAWMRQYWGGMLAEGATSFWEAYDPRWPKTDFHAFLQADNKRGYYISLAHGWASGPAAWLMEQVLGIQPTAGGFREVTLRPELAGLRFAKGAEPTPRGLLRVEVRPHDLWVTLPPGTRATVVLPFGAETAGVRCNGRALPSSAAVVDGRVQTVLDRAGTYHFTGQAK